MYVIGDASKARLIAAFIDNLVALAATFFLVALIPPSLPILKGITLIVAYLGYFIVFETLWSRTPGKYFQGLVVRTVDGSRSSWISALIRGGLRIIEVDPVLLGALPAGIAIVSTDRKQRIGDVLAGTVIVSDKYDWKRTENDVMPGVAQTE
jgi:uncharacterized RDD family membrane protein YckC